MYPWTSVVSFKYLIRRVEIADWSCPVRSSARLDGGLCFIPIRSLQLYSAVLYGFLAARIHLQLYATLREGPVGAYLTPYPLPLRDRLRLGST